MTKFRIDNNEVDTITIGMDEFADGTGVDVNINGNIVCGFNIMDNDKVRLTLYGIDEDDHIELDKGFIKIVME